MSKHSSELSPGDQYDYYAHSDKPVRVTIIGECEPHIDLFGRPQVKYLARRADTASEGYVMFGDCQVEVLT